MSAAVTKVSNAVSGLIAKSTQLTKCAVYWSEVGLELGKTVWKKEAMSPPTIEQFNQVYANAFKFLKNPQAQKQAMDKAAAFKPTKDCLVKGGVYGIQLLAFFSIGEMIGRRSITGYPKAHAEHH
ncbi:ATP synthase subunit g, mitochondrial [Diutina catenulata]